MIERFTALVDIYGALLTDRQGQVVRNYFAEDLSLAEIAELCGISRQAVYEHLLKACDQLTLYEDKLGLYAKRQQLDLKLRKLLQEACQEQVSPVLKQDLEEVIRLL